MGPGSLQTTSPGSLVSSVLLDSFQGGAGKGLYYVRGRKDWLLCQVPASYSTARTKHAGLARCGLLSGLSSGHERPGPPWVCAPATGVPPEIRTVALHASHESLVPSLPLQSGDFSCFLPWQNLRFLYLFTWFSQLLTSVKSISVLNSPLFEILIWLLFPQMNPYYLTGEYH